MATGFEKHKKKIVIALMWICSISFIGAGFVGWGSYDFGANQNTVALVGNREVSIKEYQREYNNLYSQYATVFGEQFNQEVAKQFNLENTAFKLLIKKNLLLSYADELNLYVTDEELVQELLKIPAFQKDGKFDKNTYIQVLKQNNNKPADFEIDVKRDMLLQKVEQIFTTKPKEFDLGEIAKSYHLEDNIEISILDPKNININIVDADLKNYWEQNKEKYMSEESFEIQKDVVSLISRNVSDVEITDYYSKFKNEFHKEDGTIMSQTEAKADIVKTILLQETKTAALKKYIELKKDKTSFGQKEIVKKTELNYSAEDMQAIISAKNGDILKPILSNETYVIIKIENVISPKPLDFETAKLAVTQDYLATEKQIKLVKDAQNLLKNFKGKSIGYVNIGSKEISGLSQEEVNLFLGQLFEANTSQGSIQVGNKLVVYKINDTRFKEITKEEQEAISNKILNLENQELLEKLIIQLERKYKVRTFAEESIEEN